MSKRGQKQSRVFTSVCLYTSNDSCVQSELGLNGGTRFDCSCPLLRGGERPPTPTLTAQLILAYELRNVCV